MSTTAGALLGSTYEVPQEECIEGRKESYPQLIRRLSHQSVVKHFDAYADIDWDAPEMRVDHDDPRWELSGEDVLGGTAWYRNQPAGVRSRIGLHMMASFAKIGLEFENVLKRGLLEYAQTLPNGAPEFRYVYHEVIEEAQHGLMFQEFVNRTGFDLPGLPWWARFGARQVVRFGRRFPELFFVFVLGGEDPIDHVQRQALRGGRELHPLLRRIMQIHVTEEARHLCFARHFLKQNAPKLRGLRRAVVSWRAPFILATMAQMMMRPSPRIIATYGIPKDVIAAAYTNNPVHKARTLEALAKVRGLCEEVGLVPPAVQPLWRVLGLSQDAVAPA